MNHPQCFEHLTELLEALLFFCVCVATRAESGSNSMFNFITLASLCVSGSPKQAVNSAAASPAVKVVTLTRHQLISVLRISPSKDETKSSARSARQSRWQHGALHNTTVRNVVKECEVKVPASRPQASETDETKMISRTEHFITNKRGELEIWTSISLLTLA